MLTIRVGEPYNLRFHAMGIRIKVHRFAMEDFKDNSERGEILSEVAEKETESLSELQGRLRIKNSPMHKSLQEYLDKSDATI